MPLLKCINFYSCGDSNKLTTWSNVPYLFARELEKRGYKLNRINIEPCPILNRWYNRISYLVFQRILKKDACPVFARSWMHRAIIHSKLRKIARRTDSDSCLNLFLRYLSYNKYSSRPSVLWCDWSDAIVIQRLGRAVKKYEKRHLRHESAVIKAADAVFSMFPLCRSKMEAMYDREIIYLGRNVINTVYDGAVDLPHIMQERVHSDSVLFIGNHRYLSGLQKLIDAVSVIREKGLAYHVDVIGMERSIMPSAPEWVHFHGYLDKGITAGRQEYYRLLLTAKVLVNPTAGWAGYSSIVEAMFYATPVVLYPFDDFKEEFGDTIDFGAYCGAADNLPDVITHVISAADYAQLARNAHEAVKDYTWSQYVDAFLSKLRKLDLIHD